MASRDRRAPDSGFMSEPTDGPVVSRFEFWPPYIFYAPVAAWYLLLAIRYGGLTLPMNANPSIYSGGMIGESKHAILSMVPEEQRAWFAPHATVTVRGDLNADLSAAQEAMAAAGIALPAVAKPDMGQRGAGVQRITDDAALRRYIGAFPPGRALVIQRLVPYDREAGVLWLLLPGEARGRIFSTTDKTFPFVTGDGVRTLAELIQSDARAWRLQAVYLARHRDHAERVLDAGEHFPLVFAGNHCQGCIFTNGEHLVGGGLAARIEAIASSLPEFHFGRFDCRYRDVESFRRGEAFQIVEVNGAGAEATHIWDPSTRLRNAYWTLFEQFHILFRIGAANRRRGHRPIGPWRFLRDAIAYRRLGAQYPETH